MASVQHDILTYNYVQIWKVCILTVIAKKCKYEILKEVGKVASVPPSQAKGLHSSHISTVLTTENEKKQTCNP